ncbi:MAG: alpha/beta hydrolase-fold protein [Steroidobacteraceae bacterium]
MAAQGKLEKIRVQGASLVGNLQGNDAERDVYVYLPPGYAKGNKRYPVIYFLHGYAVTVDVYVTAVLNLPAATDTAMSAGALEAIIVMPDAFTRFGGSFYSSSPTIGDWESFIAKDLVAYVDGHYRTLAKRSSRGLSGHSMGGYGTLRIGMKYPQVFGALYAMSSAVLLQAPNAETVKTQLARMTPDLKSESRSSTNGLQSQASAWASNPQNPPFYFDLPFDAEGKPVPLIAEKWIANSPLVTVDQNVPALKSFRGIALDVGNEDGLSVTNKQLDAALTRLGVAHTFEVYEGTHGNRVGARFTANVLPFFAKHLDVK